MEEILHFVREIYFLPSKIGNMGMVDELKFRDHFEYKIFPVFIWGMILALVFYVLSNDALYILLLGVATNIYYLVISPIIALFFKKKANRN